MKNIFRVHAFVRIAVVIAAFLASSNGSALADYVSPFDTATAVKMTSDYRISVMYSEGVTTFEPSDLSDDFLKNWLINKDFVVKQRAAFTGHPIQEATPPPKIERHPIELNADIKSGGKENTQNILIYVLVVIILIPVGLLVLFVFKKLGASDSNAQTNKMAVPMLFGVSIYCCLVLLGQCSNSEKSQKEHNQEVYASAMSKLDSGERLNGEEKLIVSDVMNWCKICNKPLRQCPHGSQ